MQWGLGKNASYNIVIIAESVGVASIILLILTHMHSCMNARLNLSPKAGEDLPVSFEELLGAKNIQKPHSGVHPQQIQ